MKPLRAFLLSFTALVVWAQQQPAPEAAEPSPDTVVATAGGRSITYSELKTLMTVGQLPPQAMRDRKTLVTQWALYTKLAEMAEKAKLYEDSPTRDILQISRINIMATAQINAAYSQVTVTPEEVRRFYDVSKDRYSQARVKVIYVSFNPNAATEKAPDGKKYLTEPEARAKAEKILAAIRKGADFVKMVKENSEDQVSAAKDGDFGVIRRTDNLPEAIRAVVFGLKPGEVSEPVRQPNGYYLFRVEELNVRPFDQVKEEILNERRQARFKEWMDQVQRDLNVKFENEAFFNAAAPAQPAPPAKPAK